MAKCSPFRHYEQYVKSFFHEKFCKVSVQPVQPADMMCFFRGRVGVFTCFWTEKRTSADLKTFFLIFTCFLAETWASADFMTIFFSLHSFWDRRMDICGHNDLFYFYFWSSLVFEQKNGHLRT